MTIQNFLTPRPRKLFILPATPIAEMSDEELDAVADEIAETLDLTFEEAAPDGRPERSRE